MKRIHSAFLLVLLLAACSREESSPSMGGPKTSASLKQGQFIPPMDKICKGDFDPVGLAAAFEEVAGFALPPEIKPVEGRYVVADENDWGGKYRRNYWAYYSTTPGRAAKLLEEIRSYWTKKYLSRPDWEIQHAKWNNEGAKDGPFYFSGHSETMFIFDPYASNRESFNVSIDPTSGNIQFYSYTGLAENPREREQPEK